MRARYIIRDIANGSGRAWRQAEWKLRQDNTHETPRRDLTDALATLPNPEKWKPGPPDAEGRRFAIEVHVGEDWGDAPVRDTAYDFANENEARAEAMREMWRQYCLGSTRKEIGAYVISDDAGENNGSPSVEVLLTLPL
jgi:hypothetical protein